MGETHQSPPPLSFEDPDLSPDEPPAVVVVDVPSPSLPLFPLPLSAPLSATLHMLWNQFAMELKPPCPVQASGHTPAPSEERAVTRVSAQKQDVYAAASAMAAAGGTQAPLAS